MIVDKIFDRLKKGQQEFALAALRRPQTRDTFEYGYRVGMVEGYEAAINIVLAALKEEKDVEKDL